MDFACVLLLQSDMLLLLIAGLVVGLLLLHFKSRRKFIGLPGAGLYLPFIGHYQVSCLMCSGHLATRKAVFNCSLPGSAVFQKSAITSIAISHWSLPRLAVSNWSLPALLSLVGPYQISCLSVVITSSSIFHWSQTDQPLINTTKSTAIGH